MEKLRQLLRGAAMLALAVELRDVLTFGGLGLAGYGVAGFSVPAAWIVVGGVLFLLGVRK